jgi:hypothetical protein
MKYGLIILIIGIAVFALVPLTHAFAPYDESIGVSFAQNYTVLAYNITPVIQTNPNTFDGPTYLINGYSDANWWYQAGLEYTASNTLYLLDDIFAPCTSVCPSADLRSVYFSSATYPNDKILLEMYFQGGRFFIYAKDWNTGATASLNYTANGSTKFIGTPPHMAKSSAIGFTGLMTEWYFNQSYYGPEKKVTYQPVGIPSSPAYFWIVEGGGSPITWIYHANTTYAVPAYSSTAYGFSTGNATETYQNGIFTAGGNLTAYTSIITIPPMPATNSTSIASAGSNTQYSAGDTLLGLVVIIAFVLLIIAIVRAIWKALTKPRIEK